MVVVAAEDIPAVTGTVIGHVAVAMVAIDMEDPHRPKPGLRLRLSRSKDKDGDNSSVHHSSKSNVLRCSSKLRCRSKFPCSSSHHQCSSSSSSNRNLVLVELYLMRQVFVLKEVPPAKRVAPRAINGTFRR